jgi:PilZ domain
MRSDGRIEKRATVKVPVRLVPVGNARIVEIVETTTTVNISRHGARLLTGRRWRPGEQLALTLPSGVFQRYGRVIYCRPLTDGQFCVGLEFDASIRAEKDAAWASVA